MPEDDLRLRAWGELFAQLAPLVVVLGVIGVLIIVGLVVAWRRYRRRLAALDEELAQRRAQPPVEDLWTLAAHRAASPPGPTPTPMNPPRPPADPPGAARDDDVDDDEDDEDEDDPDANAPWRQSLPEWPQFDDESDDDDDPPPPDQPPPDDEGPDEPGPQDWPRPPRR